MAEEEVTMEVEAVRAVYGDDCKILNMYPPHIEVRVKPRTADVSSQQFVEAAVQIFAGSQYPNEPPQINITRSKGLDKTRLQDLDASLQDRAHELASCSMLIALCEEAVERLSTMNHPDGDCPLCLYPFVPWDEKNELVSFMKLMSCFHCFHSHCIIQWWKWLQMESDLNCEHSVSRILPSLREQNHQDRMGKCPLCRKVLNAEDIEHITKLVGTHSVHVANEMEVHDKEKVLRSDLEATRRKKFETTLELQKECGGLIQHRNDGVLFSSIAIWDLTTTAIANDGTIPLQEIGSSSSSHNNTSEIVEPHRDSNIFGQPHGETEHQQTCRGKEPSHSPGKPFASQQRISYSRKYNRKYPRSQGNQWIKKERS